MFKILLCCAVLLSTITCFSQAYVQAGAGIATGAEVRGGGELHVGYAFKKTTFSAGYFAQIDDAAPLLVNFQAGYKLNKAVRVYGGYVRKHQSSAIKSVNSNSWIAGVEYNTKRFKRGNFYYSANYIPSYFFVCLGMKFNYK
jgi:hypothetical protein